MSEMNTENFDERFDAGDDISAVLDLEQPHVAAVPEGVGDGAVADMADAHLVEDWPGRVRVSADGHQSTPNRAAARAPARQPSSWKPQPW